MVSRFHASLLCQNILQAAVFDHFGVVFFHKADLRSAVSLPFPRLRYTPVTNNELPGFVDLVAGSIER